MSNETETKIVEVPTDEKTNVEIIPFGTDERIKLNIKIVQQMVAVPTRSGKLPDMNQCMKFIMLCKARHLNPFEGDAYLIGYDTQAGPQFSLITAHQVFLKRAEASAGFDGMESGVVVKTSNGVEERQGDLTFEGDELLGGWAKIYRSDRGRPFYRRLKLSTFNTGQSRWAKDPAGMIVKCAEADALRSAFPTHLGGLYISEERPPIDVTATSVPIPRPQIMPPHKGFAEHTAAHEPSEPKKRGRKPKAEVSEPMASPAASPSAIEIERRLKEGDSSVEELLTILRAHDFIDADEEWKDISEEKLALFLGSWPKIVTWIDEKRNAPKVTEDKLFA